ESALDGPPLAPVLCARGAGFGAAAGRAGDPAPGRGGAPGLCGAPGRGAAGLAPIAVGAFGAVGMLGFASIAAAASSLNESSCIVGFDVAGIVPAGGTVDGRAPSPVIARISITWPHLRHFIRRVFPCTFSSAIWYFALHWSQRNFIELALTS